MDNWYQEQAKHRNREAWLKAALSGIPKGLLIGIGVPLALWGIGYFVGLGLKAALEVCK